MLYFFIIKVNRRLHLTTFDILGAGEPQYLVDFRGGRLYSDSYLVWGDSNINDTSKSTPFIM